MLLTNEDESYSQRHHRCTDLREHHIIGNGAKQQRLKDTVPELQHK